MKKKTDKKPKEVWTREALIKEVISLRDHNKSLEGQVRRLLEELNNNRAYVRKLLNDLKYTDTMLESEKDISRGLAVSLAQNVHTHNEMVIKLVNEIQQLKE